MISSVSRTVAGTLLGWVIVLRLIMICPSLPIWLTGLGSYEDDAVVSRGPVVV
jgi:hypothetical protein